MKTINILSIWKKALNEPQENNEHERHREIGAQWWKDYSNKMIDVHGKEKFERLAPNAFETMSRLKASSDVARSDCTFWENDFTLCFCPTRIDLENIAQEQQKSLVVMHEDHHPVKITIRIQLSDLTWEFISKAMASAEYINIVDGIRLWTTLPYKIKNVVVKKPQNIKAFKFVLPWIISWLPSKIQKRTVIL